MDFLTKVVGMISVVERQPTADEPQHTVRRQMAAQPCGVGRSETLMLQHACKALHVSTGRRDQLRNPDSLAFQLA